DDQRLEAAELVLLWDPRVGLARVGQEERVPGLAGALGLEAHETPPGAITEPRTCESSSPKARVLRSLRGSGASGAKTPMCATVRGSSLSSDHVTVSTFPVVSTPTGRQNVTTAPWLACSIAKTSSAVFLALASRRA